MCASWRPWGARRARCGDASSRARRAAPRQNSNNSRFCVSALGAHHRRAKRAVLSTRGCAVGARARRYHRWFAAATALPSVARTLPDKERYLVHVAKYANNQARSKVGNAVRRGAAAHDYDHAVDGDGDDDAKK